MQSNSCLLCPSDNTTFFYEDDSPLYYICLDCNLVFVPPRYHLSAVEEKKRYANHENDPADEQYRQFLGRLFNPINQRIKPQSKGLDFGAGANSF